MSPESPAGELPYLHGRDKIASDGQSFVALAFSNTGADQHVLQPYQVIQENGEDRMSPMSGLTGLAGNAYGITYVPSVNKYMLINIQSSGWSTV